VDQLVKCFACGQRELAEFADLGDIPVLCGVHYATEAEALGSPLGRMTLGYCDRCAYVRNIAFDPDALVYDTTMDTNLHHSPAFQSFSADLVRSLAARFDLAGKVILDIGCGQGEFLRELCHDAGATGFGYDAMYAGVEGPDPSGAHFTTGYAPLRDPELPNFDVVTSRHWFEHIDDPYDFLVALRERAADRPVYGYFEVPDAGYDLATAGWEVIYPHVSYFESTSLRSIFERAGWQVTGGGTMFHGMFRFLEVATNTTAPIVAGPAATPEPALAAGSAGDARDRQLAAIGGFAERQRAEVSRWRATIDELSAQGKRPVMWGAGSRGVQFLTFADPGRQLAAVVDVNPRKWGRYLPMTAHRVEAPDVLREIKPTTVIITNPAYRDEIAKSLSDYGVIADILVA
jgi:Methyltransferase domain/C-methyltransferase C-terminal domain